VAPARVPFEGSPVGLRRVPCQAVLTEVQPRAIRAVA
jgi:hypothetical protein